MGCCCLAIHSAAAAAFPFAFAPTAAPMPLPAPPPPLLGPWSKCGMMGGVECGCGDMASEAAVELWRLFGSSARSLTSTTAPISPLHSRFPRPLPFSALILIH